MMVSVNCQITVCTCWQTSSRALHARSSLPSSRFARTNHRLAVTRTNHVSLRTDEPSSRCCTDEPSSRGHTDEPSSRFARTNHRLASHGRTTLRTDNHFSSGRPRSLPCLDRDVLCDAIVTHIYQARVYIIVVDTLLLSVSRSEGCEERQNNMVSIYALNAGQVRKR